MDNDSLIKKKLVKAYRNARLKIDYAGLYSEEKGNQLIADRLVQDNPFMVGRLGAVEMHCASRWMNGEHYSDKEMDQALYAAGIFPNDSRTIDKFCEIYTDSLKSCDVLGVWEVEGEKKAIRKYCPQAKLIPSRSIEPYYYENPWSVKLKGKKLLVIHPFSKTIENQFKNRTLLFDHAGGGTA